MTTVVILPTRDASGEKSYRAMSDDKPLCVREIFVRYSTSGSYEVHPQS
ncbi:MAG: hypothetical protein V7K97_04010 [Nostoc sp.]